MGREQFSHCVTESRHVIHHRLLEQEMFWNEGILWFRCQESQQQDDIPKSCNFCTTAHTLELEMHWKEENRRRKEKVGCPSTHENDAFSRRWCWDALRCPEGKRLTILHRRLKNRKRLGINKSRSYCSCEIRQAFVPPPFPSTSRKRPPFQPTCILSN